MKPELQAPPHSIAELEAARTYAESIVDTVREPLVVVDRDLRIRSANRSFYERFNKREEEIEGRLLSELDRGFWNAPDLLCRLESILAKNGELDDFEVSGEVSHLGLRTMLLNVRKIFNEETHAGMFLISIEDVTERRRMEASLKNERDMLKELMDNATESIYFKDRDGHFIPIDRFLATKPDILHRVEDVTEFVQQKNGAAPQRDGLQARMERMEAEMFRSLQQVEAANQQLRAANEELEAFSYSVSHDLRAPLRHIDGYAGMLAKRSGATLDEKGVHYLSTISESAKKMGALIDDLLIFSRMGRAQMKRVTIDMKSLTRGVLREVKEDAPGRNIVWECQALPDVEGDPALLRQVLVNLIANAVKYSRPRDPAVIEIGSTDGAPGETVFFVRDNGVGFDMAHADKLFGVFQRLHSASEFEGTGIGLANVRRIVLRHGGRTWAESKPGEGAKFYFSLPKALNFADPIDHPATSQLS